MTHTKFAYAVTHVSYLYTWGKKYYFAYGEVLKVTDEMVNCS